MPQHANKHWGQFVAVWFCTQDNTDTDHGSNSNQQIGCGEKVLLQRYDYALELLFCLATDVSANLGDRRENKAIGGENTNTSNKKINLYPVIVLDAWENRTAFLRSDKDKICQTIVSA